MTEAEVSVRFSMSLIEPDHALPPVLYAHTDWHRAARAMFIVVHTKLVGTVGVDSNTLRDRI